MLQNVNHPVTVFCVYAGSLFEKCKSKSGAAHPAAGLNPFEEEDLSVRTHSLTRNKDPTARARASLRASQRASDGSGYKVPCLNTFDDDDMGSVGSLQRYSRTEADSIQSRKVPTPANPFEVDDDDDSSSRSSHLSPAESTKSSVEGSSLERRKNQRNSAGGSVCLDPGLSPSHRFGHQRPVYTGTPPTTPPDQRVRVKEISPPRLSPSRSASAVATDHPLTGVTVGKCHNKPAPLPPVNSPPR